MEVVGGNISGKLKHLEIAKKLCFWGKFTKNITGYEYSTVNARERKRERKRVVACLPEQLSTTFLGILVVFFLLVKKKPTLF